MDGKTKILLTVVCALVVIVAVLLVSPMVFNRGSGASASSVREIPTSSTGANAGIVVDKPDHEMMHQQFWAKAHFSPVTELPAGTVIDGYPVARGQFNAKGEVKAFYSSAPIEFHGDTLPKGTWVRLDADQRIDTCVFPEDTTIQGHRIRGGDTGGELTTEGYIAQNGDKVTVYYIEQGVILSLKNLPPSVVRFYPDGELQKFNSREDVMFRDVPCSGNSFAEIVLWENGELQGCTAARDATVGGVSLKAGEIVARGAQGRLLNQGEPRWLKKTATWLTRWW
ncbi:MAG: hypothetical protein LBP68_02405 [Acidobacteriota bacterium]|nr:hypothetical protein [Acidobacteriota bacterium]